jgi:HPt (histidine-containing phosphotransfer) domain-containing protein
MRKLSGAVEVGDATLLREASHELKGTAGIFGARSVAELAKSLEMMARAGDLDDAARSLALLEVEIESFKEALGAFVLQLA